VVGWGEQIERFEQFVFDPVCGAWIVRCYELPDFADDPARQEGAARSGTSDLREPGLMMSFQAAAGFLWVHRRDFAAYCLGMSPAEF